MSAAFRVITTDGFILAECSRRRFAVQTAQHRAGYMGEPMLVQRWSEDVGWIDVERVEAER